AQLWLGRRGSSDCLARVLGRRRAGPPPAAKGETGMDPESTVRAGERSLPEWATRFTDNALVGWIVIAGLTGIGFLLFLPAKEGTPSWPPPWPAWVFAAIGIGGIALYGAKVFPFFRRL